MKNNYYVYEHFVRGQIFYVGIGSKPNYIRAKEKHSDQSYWVNEVGNDKWTYKIIREGLTLAEASEDEKCLIYVYGRRCDGGVLVNKSLGGNSSRGVKRYTDEEIKEHKKEYLNRPEIKERKRKQYRENCQRYKEHKKEYRNRPEIKEKRKEYNKKYCEINREKILNQKKEYNNRPEVKERQKEWYKNKKTI